MKPLAAIIALVATAGAAAHVQELERDGLKYELFVPASLRRAQHLTSLRPVIVFLHGRGESGAFGVTNAQSLPMQLLSNRTFADALEFIVIIPQCPAECAYQNGWMPETLQKITSLVRSHVIPELSGDPARIYLAGQSMGGHGAWFYAAQQPRLYAAVVVVCGYAQGSREARAFAERLATYRTAVAVYHSADDSVIPVGASDQMVQHLRERGYGAPGGALALKYVRYEHAPGPPMPEFAHLIGHGSYELAFRDAGLYSWLLEQSCTKCARANRPPAEWSPLEI